MNKKDEIIELLNKDFKTGDIMKRTSASMSYVCALRAIYRPKQYKKKDILHLLERGMSPSYIAEKTNVSIWYVYNLSSESGFSMKKKSFNFKLNKILRVMPLNEPISISDVSTRLGNNNYNRNTNDWYRTSRLIPLFRALKDRNLIVRGKPIHYKNEAHYWIKTTENSPSVSNET